MPFPGPTCLEQGLLGPPGLSSFLQHSNPTEFAPESVLSSFLAQKPWLETTSALAARVLVGSSHSLASFTPGLACELEGPPGREAQGASKQVYPSQQVSDTRLPSGPCQLTQGSALWALLATALRFFQRFLNQAHIQSSQHPEEAGKAGMVIPILQMRNEALEDSVPWTVRAGRWGMHPDQGPLPECWPRAPGGLFLW